MKNQTKDKVVIYRMEIGNHICPYGLKALHILKKHYYDIEDIVFATRKEVDEFKQKHKLQTTPQIFIDDKSIGGYSELKEYLNKNPRWYKKYLKYESISLIFTFTFLMTAATITRFITHSSFMETFEMFMGYSICALAILKFKNLESFSTQFLTYDLLAQKWITYSYLYPTLEALIGLSILANSHFLLAGPITLITGSIGAYSVFKAVYIDKRNLKCACIGGESTVPLGAISLIENIMMIAMGIIMIKSLF